VERLVNQTALLERFDGEEELLAELAELFAQDCPRLFQESRDALVAGNASGVMRAAHTLKGAVGNFCAPAAAVAALRLEMLGQSGHLAEAPAALAELEILFGQLNAELAALTPEKASP
jgi:HPt (histidine-containing phosphotransfer) domain-containing protein